MALRLYISPSWWIPMLILLTATHALDAGDLCSWDALDSSYGKSFTPWFRGWKNITSGFGTSDKKTVNNMACWWYADCIFSLAAETRKQQYSAIGIVMALIPFILKDIAWPHRRIVLSPKRHLVVEIIVRALGLNPVPRRSKRASGGQDIQSAGVSNFVCVSSSTLATWLWDAGCDGSIFEALVARMSSSRFCGIVVHHCPFAGSH